MAVLSRAYCLSLFPSTAQQIFSHLPGNLGSWELAVILKTMRERWRKYLPCCSVLWRAWSSLLQHWTRQIEAIWETFSKSTKAEAVLGPKLSLPCGLDAEEAEWCSVWQGKVLRAPWCCSNLHRNRGVLEQNKQKYQRKQLTSAV